MKKAFFISCFVSISFFLSLGVTNAASNFSEIQTTEELHQELKNQKMILLDENGMIALPDNIDSLGAKQNLIDEYINMIDLTNQQIEDGIISMDQELNVEPFTVEEVADKVYQLDQKQNETLQPQADSCISLVHLVEKNRDELEEVFRTQLAVNPTSAYTFAVGWWVGKVMEGGAWDYKIQPGYAPWYKTFCMLHYNGVVLEHNSKWLGNYNYGYTGELLFSLSVLHAGGDAISYALNWRPDGKEAKDAIEWGFSDAYWFY
ncbi:toxin 44 [Evansella caseinilytica]|uniref:Toxin 44 n=1 Tax=Evansella caseinilytica TaxID=1503961 RepID=A0A1H3V307_9BACI|nr:polymorphic toxin type 44 domain-containing protein [Evansella caseinilytica]SDZ68439.1 toxin 44 [Evansella caseinilytica]